MLCVGETLWDVLPQGEFLGGAPLNVAAHLVRLGRPALPVTRVGDDARGAEAVRRMRSLGIATDLVQLDRELPTGEARAVIGADGAAAYAFKQPAAWDRLASTDEAVAAAATAAAVVFGTLAQRAPESRDAIRRLVDAAEWSVLDLNLRPPHADLEVVRASLERAHLVKLNEDELHVVSGWLGIPADADSLQHALQDRFGTRSLCITMGAAGARLWHEGRWHDQPSFPTTVADTVGAGDSFLATLIAGLLANRPAATALRQAARVAAFVASQHGAIPDYDPAPLLAP